MLFIKEDNTVCRKVLFLMIVSMLLFTSCTEDSAEPTKSNAEPQTPVTEKTVKESAEKQQEQVTEKIEKKVTEAKPVPTNKVKLETSLGDIVIELDLEKAPITTKNFLDYVNAGYYNGTIFHRVIKDFMIQGGGFTDNMQKKSTKAPIKNEANNELKNLRGTISMARTNDPHSATSQFFINHKNNSFLDYSSANPGYAVFGKVVEGMEAVDKIAVVQTGVTAGMRDVPVEVVTITSASVVTK